MITPITSKLLIHNQSLDDWEFRGGYKILFVEVSLVAESLTERISDEVIKDFLAIIIFPQYLFLRHGSNERDSSSLTDRSSPVMLSAAKHLRAHRDRPFA